MDHFREESEIVLLNKIDFWPDPASISLGFVFCFGFGMLFGVFLPI